MESGLGTELVHHMFISMSASSRAALCSFYIIPQNVGRDSN